jgi:Flp pilus assembly protein TadG
MHSGTILLWVVDLKSSIVNCLSTNPGSTIRRRSVSIRRSPLRRGVAVLEAAITLPILVILVFGTIELTDGIFTKQSLAIGAYEGIRVATRPGGTSTQARAKIDEILAARNVSGYTVVINPAVTEDTTRGTQVTISVTVPAGTLTAGPLQLFSSRNIVYRVRMVRL